MKSIQSRIWNEAYRPKNIEDTILPKSIKQKFINFRDSGKEIPNLLLNGPAGTGKTTIAKALMRELDMDYMIINGSDSADSGIDALRTRIKTFASSMSLEGKRKFVIIDECDHLSPAVQPALREFMERFANNCGFIMTSNYRNRIIDPLQSRLSLVEFHIAKEDRPEVFKQFLDRVYEILENEGVQYDKKVIAEFVVQHFPDFRKIINELQMQSVTGVIDKNILTKVREDNIAELYDTLKSKQFSRMRKWVADNVDLGSETIFRKMYETIDKFAKPSFVPNMIIILADYQDKATRVPDTELNMVAAFTEIMAEGEWK